MTAISMNENNEVKFSDVVDRIRRDREHLELKKKGFRDNEELRAFILDMARMVEADPVNTIESVYPVELVMIARYEPSELTLEKKIECRTEVMDTLYDLAMAEKLALSNIRREHGAMVACDFKIYS